MNRRSVTVSFLDQGVVSVTTISLSLALIIFGTPAAFGQFTFFLTLVLIAASLQHGLIGIHVLVSIRPKSRDDRLQALRTLTDFDLWFRWLACFLIMGLGLLVTHDPLILASAGLFVWVYLWRETIRNILFATERGGRALLIDGLALVGTTLLLVVLLKAEVSALAPLLSAGIAYGICLMMFARGLHGTDKARRSMRPDDVVRRFRSDFSQSGWTLLDSAANEVQMRGYVIVVEAMRGVTQLGILEAGRVLWGPLVLLVSAWRRVAQPHLAVLLEREAIGSARLVTFAGVALALIFGGAYAGLLTLAWPLLDTYIFKGGFDEASAFVLGWGIYTLALISNWMLAIFLNAARRFRLVASIVVVSAIASLLLLSILAFGAQLITVIYGMIAIQYAVFTVLCVLVFTIEVEKPVNAMQQEQPA